MKGKKIFDTVFFFDYLSVFCGNGNFAFQNSFRSNSAKKNDNLGLNDGKLFEQMNSAMRDICGFGRPTRSPVRTIWQIFYGTCDINIFFFESNLTDQTPQQLP